MGIKKMLISKLKKYCKKLHQNTENSFMLNSSQKKVELKQSTHLEKAPKTGSNLYGHISKTEKTESTDSFFLKSKNLLTRRRRHHLTNRCPPLVLSLPNLVDLS